MYKAGKILNVLFIKKFWIFIEVVFIYSFINKEVIKKPLKTKKILTPKF